MLSLFPSCSVRCNDYMSRGLRGFLRVRQHPVAEKRKASDSMEESISSRKKNVILLDKESAYTPPGAPKILQYAPPPGRILLSSEH